MKKKYIVKTHDEFNYIINNGRKKNSKYFVINYIDNKLYYSRYGVSVGTKLGNAVTRNKYKRKMRAIIDGNEKISSYKYDFIILLRKSGIGVDYKELKKDFDYLINKLKEI